MARNEHAYKQIFTAANIVTTIRIALIPVFVVIILAPWPSWIRDYEVSSLLEGLKPLIAAAVFALLALTDSVDGYLARSRNEITTLGKFLDPLADKILVTAALLALVEFRSLPVWVALVIIGREFLVSGLRMVASAEGLVIAASQLGKLKTLAQVIAVLLFIVKESPFVGELAQPMPLVVYITAWTVMVVALALTLLSLADYFFKSSAALGLPLRGRADDLDTVADAVAKVVSEVVADADAEADVSGISGASGTSDSASFSKDCHTEAFSVIDLARARGLTIATAESCTGGRISACLTEVPGASEVFLGAVVSYANEVKEEVLGVSHETLSEKGAVSADTAEAMARGALATLGADMAISVTGIAGPDGGSNDKPVGTVWFGLACRINGESMTHTELHHFKGTRTQIQTQATHRAISILAEKLESLP